MFGFARKINENDIRIATAMRKIADSLPVEHSVIRESANRIELGRGRADDYAFATMLFNRSTVKI